MSVIRWEPFRELGTLQDRMNRLFDEASRGWQPGDHGAMTAWNPAVDICESASAITVRAELPGIKRDDIELSLENNTLTLRGERKFENEEENEHKASEMAEAPMYRRSRWNHTTS